MFGTVKIGWRTLYVDRNGNTHTLKEDAIAASVK